MSTVTAEQRARADALAPDFILEKEIGRGGSLRYSPRIHSGRWSR